MAARLPRKTFGLPRRLRRDSLPGFSLKILYHHLRENGYPVFSAGYWIPAYAGMTEKNESPDRMAKEKRGEQGSA